MVGNQFFGCLRQRHNLRFETFTTAPYCGSHFEDARCRYFVQFADKLLVSFRKKEAGCFFYIRFNLPAFFIIGSCFCKIDQQAGEIRINACFADQLVSSFVEHKVAVHFYFEINRQVQVVGKSTDDTRYKTIDGTHREIIVFVKYTGKHRLSTRSNFRGFQPGNFHQVGKHKFNNRALGKSFRFSKLHQALHNALFHFVGCFVGKRNSQDVPEIGRRLQSKGNIFAYQGIGFSRPG